MPVIVKYTKDEETVTVAFPAGVDPFLVLAAARKHFFPDAKEDQYDPEAEKIQRFGIAKAKDALRGSLKPYHGPKAWKGPSKP
jgi:hypothetical protein